MWFYFALFLLLVSNKLFNLYTLKKKICNVVTLIMSFSTIMFSVNKYMHF